MPGVQYKMKDWAFNRQRYWGEPIPIVHCPDLRRRGRSVMMELPLRLPAGGRLPAGRGRTSHLWQRSNPSSTAPVPKCGAEAKRETDTMPQWARFFLVFPALYRSAQRQRTLAAIRTSSATGCRQTGTTEELEHATRHMIYSRFWHHFLYDIGAVNTPEPYAKRSAQGTDPRCRTATRSASPRATSWTRWISWKSTAQIPCEPMCCSWETTARPAPWSDSSVKGCKRFLERVAGLTDIMTDASADPETQKLETAFHKAIKKVSSQISRHMKFNTAIACLMTLVNDVYTPGAKSAGMHLRDLSSSLLCPFAPAPLRGDLGVQSAERASCLFPNGRSTMRQRRLSRRLRSAFRSMVS